MDNLLKFHEILLDRQEACVNLLMKYITEGKEEQFIEGATQRLYEINCLLEESYKILNNEADK